MKILFLVVGLVLLLVGAVVALLGFSIGASASAMYTTCINSGVPFPQGVCESFRSTASLYTTLGYVGSGLAVAGLGLAVFGLVSKGPEEAAWLGRSAPAPSRQPPSSMSPPCPVCGMSLLWIPEYGRWYCSRCGHYR